MIIKEKLKIKIFVALAVVLFLCIFSEKVYAEDNNDSLYMYYYSFKDDGKEYFDSESFCFFGSFTEEQKAFIIFDNLFNNTEKDKINFVPEGTKILDIIIKDDILVLNVTNEIRNYGGTSYETAMIKQLAINALNFKGVKRLTLMFNGNYGALPEGKFIFEYEIGEILGEI